MAKEIKVEVVYATPTVQRILSVLVMEGSTIEAVIYRSGILNFFCEIDLTRQKVGIFGQQKTLAEIVREGDRVEIYRPLLIDPKEARRKRAQKNMK